jgi:hypothetical protein
MRSGTKGLIVALALVAVATLWFAVPTPGQAPSSPGIKRAEDGKPNLDGIWQSLTTANWDIEAHNAEPGPRPEIMGAWGAQPAGLGIVEGGEIPYRPEALARKKQKRETRMVVKTTNDPHRFDTGDTELQCFRPGVPRANYMPFPFQIFQDRDAILIVHEYKGASRTIYMNPHRDPPGDTWMGWSNGRWDGDTLVVDVTGFNGYAWFDRAGNFASDALHVVERWTPKGPDHIAYEATIEDPTVFTRPWKVSFPIYRRIEPNAQLFDFQCVPFVEEMMYNPLGLYTPPDRGTR